MTTLTHYVRLFRPRVLHALQLLLIGQKGKKSRPQRVLRWVGLPLIGLAIVGSVASAFGIMINTSPSMPVGLYRKAPTGRLHLGSIVAICLSTKLAQAALAKGYVGKSALCPSGAEPLIKEVIALPGDSVTVTSDQITVIGANGKRNHYFAPRHRWSLSHHPVATLIAPGHYHATGLWLYGAGATNWSWDSRYFGALQTSAVVAQLVPVWTLKTGSFSRGHFYA